MTEQRWLVKSEPDVYAYADLERDGKTVWDHVRNYAARLHLRGMKKGDLVLYYHSGGEKAVVGICQVVREAYPEKTTDEGDWSVVDLAPVRRLPAPVPLAAVKAQKSLATIALVRQGRLSVMPLSKAQFDRIVSLAR